MSKKKLFSKCILKQSVKGSWKLWTILTCVLCFLVFLIGITSKGTADYMREEGMDAETAESTLSSFFFASNAFMYIVVLIFIIAVGQRLVVGEVDRGTMSFTLNTVTTRKQIVLSKALFYLASIFSMVLAMGVLGLGSALLVGADINIGKYALIILGCLLFSFATSGIVFFASCFFNKGGRSMMVGCGLPIVFFLLSFMSPVLKMGKHEILKYFSMNTLFNADGILSGTGGYIIPLVVLFLIGVALYVGAIVKFIKKDLPL